MSGSDINPPWAVHNLQASGFAGGCSLADIDKRLELLKVHLPYHESDHVLNLAYNILAGGQRLEDIELRRNDEVFLNGLGAERIPDPTTAGDFTRRFSPENILPLQECINRSRLAVWKVQPEGFLKEAFVDVDGTMAQTYGECKEGMDISYKGIWGYAPLIVSLANTKEGLYLVNRPGNAVSHSGSVEWIDRAVDLVGQVAGRVTLRGDTDFTHPEQLDRWGTNGAIRKPITPVAKMGGRWCHTKRIRCQRD